MTSCSIKCNGADRTTGSNVLSKLRCTLLIFFNLKFSFSRLPLSFYVLCRQRHIHIRPLYDEKSFDLFGHKIKKISSFDVVNQAMSLPG